MITSEQHTIKTYRYLRIAMVGLVATLFTAVGYEMVQKDLDCFQTSISAYYYTPAQAIFVGTLIAIGVCLVAVKGNTEWEDIFLNISGMLAPVVALVPTPGPGKCQTVKVDRIEADAAIENNVYSILLVGVLGVLVSAALAWRERRRRAAADVAGSDRSPYGVLIALAILIGGGAWFCTDRGSFTDKAHYAAALTMFGFIVLVVVWNAWQFGKKDTGSYANRYAVIALLMVGSLVVLGGYAWLADWDHAVLWIEGVLITLFAT